MKKETVENCAYLASMLIATTLIASCERDSGGNSGNSSKPRSERSHSPAEGVNTNETAPTPTSKDLPFQVLRLSRSPAAGSRSVQDECFKLVADYAESSGLSLGESCLWLWEAERKNLKPDEQKLLLTLLRWSLRGNHKEKNVIALGLPPGILRTGFISAHLGTMRDDLAVDELQALHEGLGPGRDRTSSAVSVARTIWDRDGLSTAAGWASELELPEEREAAFVELAREFVRRGLDQEGEDRTGYERLMELAEAAGETVHSRVRGQFHTVPIKVIDPEERKKQSESPKSKPESE